MQQGEVDLVLFEIGLLVDDLEGLGCEACAVRGRGAEGGDGDDVAALEGEVSHIDGADDPHGRVFVTGFEHGDAVVHLHRY